MPIVNDTSIVQILLSTYNGATYLKPQLDSLLQQDYPHLEIMVRDDGSSDATINILQEYAAVHSHVHLILGENIGFIQSFFQLIVQASPTAAYIAFSDQDDLWLPNRISRAVATLNSHPQSIPTLYATSARVVDQNLTMLGSLTVPQHILAFPNALVECPLLGCTFLINQALLANFSKKIPQHSYGHDWWLYLLASAFGEIIYDPETGLLYRQHGNNLFGAASNTSTTYKDQHQAFAAKLHQFQKRMYRYANEGPQRRVTEQAREFQHIYQSLLTSKHQQILENFLTCRKT